MEARVSPGADRRGRGERGAARYVRCGVIAALFSAAAAFVCAALPVSAQSLEERLPACFACHGENGRSENPEVPSLGGQPEFYLTIQLYMFREKLRHVEIMNDVMKGLSDDDLKKLAATLAKLPPPQPQDGAPDPAKAEQVQGVVTQNRCNFCHGRNFAGDQNVPRLAGQREDYLVKTLREYKNNSRRGYDASMADVLYGVNDEQIAALAHFLARQP
jgi:cytochrome c553